MLVYDMFMRLIQKYTHKLTSYINPCPYITINFHEFNGESSSLMRNEAYTAIQSYLTQQHSSSSSQKATRQKAEVVKDCHVPLVRSMEDSDKIIDEFQGVKLWWEWDSHKTTNPKTKTYSFSTDPDPDPVSDGIENRCYKLTFHKNHRDLIIGSYLKHVLQEARSIGMMENRHLKLYTNNKTEWSHVIFQHPATFETLAMNPNKKEEIINDLVKFKTGKSDYAKIGKPWKRGYLLYGPPGTGKSSMIFAMANFMNYDVYDLELTTVNDNSDLRKLLLNTSSKSIIVIEDIDCSLDLIGQRNKKKKKKKEKYYVRRGDKDDDDDDDEGSKVTLSGLLNVIDGIWSTCGGERIIVFTTNFVEKLDPALIRKGRMDMQIELSYCCYKAFKVLAKNYLDIESHNLFPRIKNLLEEAQMTPADVARNLIPESLNEENDTCLNNLIQALEKSKEDSKKAGEKVRKRAEEDDVANNAERKNGSNPTHKRIKVE